MGLPDLLILGVVIGSNNFAVALALGALGQGKRRLQIVSVFGGFEFVIPLAGILIGGALAGSIGSQAALIGAVLLCILGFGSIIGALRGGGKDELLAKRVSSPGGLFFLAAVLSLDNLLVGFSLGLARAEPLLVAGTIAFFAVIFTWLGLAAGCESRRHWEKKAEFAAGGLLIILGLAIAAGWL